MIKKCGLLSSVLFRSPQFIGNSCRRHIFIELRGPASNFQNNDQQAAEKYGYGCSNCRDV
ncbi:MAG: hypothetical protein HOF72_05295 [Planctomycetaceae bacterium]|nr:hypothetical protein [Planctomycetaceae bacterium]